jgi:hypothetical protein
MPSGTLLSVEVPVVVVPGAKAAVTGKESAITDVSVTEQVPVAVPIASVVQVLLLRRAPGAVKATTCPLTGAPVSSSTVAVTVYESEPLATT